MEIIHKSSRFGNLKFHITLGDFFFLLAMTFVLAFPNPSIYKAVSIIAFFCYTIVLALIRREWTNNLLQYVWLVGFFVFCHASKYWSVYPSAIPEVIQNVQWCMLLSLATANYVKLYKMTVTDVAKRILVVALLFAINIGLNGTFVDGRFTVIIDGYQINENTFGQIAIGLAAYMVYWSKKKSWKNLFVNLMIVFTIVLALISGSRKCFISLTIYAIAFLLYEHPPKNIIRFLTRMIAMVAVVVAVYILVMNVDALYQAVGVRIESLFDFFEGDLEADASANTRLLMIETAYKMFQEKPMLGYGLNTFSKITSFDAYAHNNYVELLANLGLIGFLIYYLPLFFFFGKATKRWLQNKNGAIFSVAILFGFFVNDLAAVSYFSMTSHAFIGLAIGFCLKDRKERKKYDQIEEGSGRLFGG